MQPRIFSHRTGELLEAAWTVLCMWQLFSSTHSAQGAVIDVFLLGHFDGGLIVLLEMVAVPQTPRHCPLQQRMQLIIVILRKRREQDLV